MTTDITLAASTSGPSIVLPFAGVDLSEHTLVMNVQWRGGSLDLSSEDGGLSLSVATVDDVVTSRVTWAYTLEQANSLPQGAIAIYDLFATLSQTHKISAGRIKVDGPGQLSLASDVVVEVPGLQGPRGWSPVFGTPAYGTSIVLRVVDWTGGGQGAKPAIGQYMGPAGLVNDIEDATLFPSVAAADAAVAAAAGSAGAAATQAGIATGAASVATTQAGNSATSATDSATSATASATARTGSEAARAGSEAARDAAFINANVYADEATGRAAVADGVQFQVVSVDGLTITRYRRVNSGSSVVVATYPSKLAINSITPYGVSIYNAAGVPIGSYYADRSVPAVGTISRIYAEIIAGSAGATATLYLGIGATVHGPYVVTYGTPVNLTGLSIAVAGGDSVTWSVDAKTGTVIEVFAKAYGATGS